MICLSLLRISGYRLMPRRRHTRDNQSASYREKIVVRRGRANYIGQAT